MNKHFKENKYVVVENAIPKEVAEFITQYFLLKKKCVETMTYMKTISPYVDYFGYWDDPQAPNTYSHYADFAMETLLLGLKNLMQEVTGLELYENYSYARVYKYGDLLRRHRDRFSCEISTTLNLGGDPWPIYLDPTGGTNNEGVQVDLKPGDMLVYRGAELEHWRYPFIGNKCVQVFLHYNNKNTEGAEKNKYDGRPFVGLPGCFREER